MPSWGFCLPKIFGRPEVCAYDHSGRANYTIVPERLSNTNFKHSDPKLGQTTQKWAKIAKSDLLAQILGSRAIRRKKATYSKK